MKWLLLICVFLSIPARGDSIVVGSKNFTEQFILGEILAQLIESRTELDVERKFNLGGTTFTLEALRGGNIDIYPEYTGTGLVNILKMEVKRDANEVLETVRSEFRERYGLHWLSPFGFNNTYALAVRKDSFPGVKTVSQLRRKTPNLVLGGSHEFLDRPDGYKGFARTYELSFKDLKTLSPGLMYTAIKNEQVQVIAAFSTDGRIPAFNLRLIEDDRHYFPPYWAAPLIRQDTLEKHKELSPLLEELAGKIGNDQMRNLNFQVDSMGISVEQAARQFLLKQGLIAGSAGPLDRSETSLLQYFWNQRSYLLDLVREHLLLTGVALLLAILVGVPLGISLTRFEALVSPTFGVINTFQTIPSLALLGFLIPILGIGKVPAIVALFIYALLPIVRNTFTGIRGVDGALVEASRGIGLTDLQILTKVELPIAIPTVMAGMRTSTVIIVGTATLASLVGAGGLGDPIFQGISSVMPRKILLGAIPAALLAIALDRTLQFAETRLVSKGLRRPK